MTGCAAMALLAKGAAWLSRLSSHWTKQRFRGNSHPGLHAGDRCRVAAVSVRHLDEGIVDGCFWLAEGWLSGPFRRLGQIDLRSPLQDQTCASQDLAHLQETVPMRL